MILFKQAKKELHHLVHPRAVSVVRLEGKVVDKSVLKTVFGYLIIYMGCIAATTLLLSLDEPDFATNFTASVSCLNNIGPGLGKIGPMDNYAFYAPASKVLLALGMLAGRLEFFPMFVLFNPTTYRGRD